MSAVNQIVGAIGIGVLRTIFFSTATDGATTGPPSLIDYSNALNVVLLITAGVYIVTAMVMLQLPKTAPNAEDN